MHERMAYSTPADVTGALVVMGARVVTGAAVVTADTADKM